MLHKNHKTFFLLHFFSISPVSRNVIMSSSSENGWRLVICITKYPSFWNYIYLNLEYHLIINSVGSSIELLKDCSYSLGVLEARVSNARAWKYLEIRIRSGTNVKGSRLKLLGNSRYLDLARSSHKMKWSSTNTT